MCLLLRECDGLVLKLFLISLTFMFTLLYVNFSYGKVRGLRV